MWTDGRYLNFLSRFFLFNFAVIFRTILGLKQINLLLYEDFSAFGGSQLLFLCHITRATMQTRYEKSVKEKSKKSSLSSLITMYVSFFFFFTLPSTFLCLVLFILSPLKLFFFSSRSCSQQFVLLDQHLRAR